MRTAFIESLTAQARRNPRVFLVVGDLGYSVVEPFAREFPERFLNAGVAEQNLTGVAAGLASEGYHVFTYSIANFPTFRCAEFIRNDVGYHALPVTVVSVGGGVAYGNLGYSHHAVQDLALMRSLPNLVVASPGDPVETGACVDYLARHPGPGYLRLGKNGEARLHPAGLALDAPVIVPVAGRADAPRSLLSTGGALAVAVKAWQACEPALQAQWSVSSLPVWNLPAATVALRAHVAAHEEVVTIEDHLAAGGFGSYVQECLADEPGLVARIGRCALSDAVCGAVAKQDALMELGGLSAAKVAARMGGGRR